MRRNRAAVCGFALAALLAGRAEASPGEAYGTTPRGVATVGTLTAGADDASAAFYNPAGLGLAAKDGKTQIGLGYLGGVPFMGIHRDIGDANHLDKYPTQLPPGQGFASISALFPLGGKLQNKAAIGLSMAMPQNKLARVQLLDPKLPQWLRYASSPDRFELAVGLGMRFGDKVAVGVGTSVLAGLEGVVDFQIDLFGKKVDRRNLDFALKPTAAPIAGFTVTPTDDLRLAFNYRGAIELDIKQPNSIDMGDFGTLLLDVAGAVHYSPHQFAVGASLDVSPQVRLLLDAKLDLWSLAPYPAANVKVDLSGELAKALGLDKAFAMETKDPATGFQNTVTPSFAMEYTFPDKVTKLRGGYAFRPTYVPDQTRSFSNFLDNTAHILGFGATFQFHDPSEVFSQPLKFEIAAQGQVFQRREVKKEQGSSDPVGNYDFGGAAIAGAAQIRYDF